MIAWVNIIIFANNKTLFMTLTLSHKHYIIQTTNAKTGNKNFIRSLTIKEQEPYE